MRLLLFFGCILIAIGTPAHAAGYRCPDSKTIVSSDSELDARLACAGAGDAVAFLARLGLDVGARLHIEVRDRVFLHTEGKRPSFRILGQFDAERGRILVTSTAGQRAMAEEKPIFGVPYENALFRSVVAHEVGHAVAEDNFRVETPSRLAHEYIAYVVQLSTMPAALRERILDHNRAPAFESEFEMNPITYGFDPDLFGIKAYRHYHGAGGGPAFVEHLLSRGLMVLFPPWGHHAAEDPLSVR